MLNASFTDDLYSLYRILVLGFHSEIVSDFHKIRYGFYLFQESVLSTNIAKKNPDDSKTFSSGRHVITCKLDIQHSVNIHCRVNYLKKQLQERHNGYMIIQFIEYILNQL